MKNQFLPIKWCGVVALGFLALASPVQAQFNHTTNDGEITITGYIGGAAVVIPDTINGYPVTAIGENAFAYAWPLSSITLPASLTRIGGGAFSFCSLLTEVVIPNGVTNIGSGAFFSSALINVTIPDSVTSIGYAAFNSTHITNIILPANLTVIEGEQFNACNYLQSVSLPSGITSIGNNAFGSCYALDNLTIPNGVTNIGADAFGYSGLTNIAIPASVLAIGEGAFKSCRYLAAINVAPLNPVYSSPDGVLFDKDQTTLLMFPQGRTGRYRIPDGVTTISADVFNFGGEIQLPSPSSIIVPASVTNIGYAAFSGCPNLTTLFFLGDTVTNLGGDVFYFTDNVIIYYLPGTTGWQPMFDTRPTALWNPQVPPGSIGMPTNQYGFTITGTANIPVVIETSTNLVGTWDVLQSLRLTNGAVYFSDPQSANHPQRFYRLSAP
jgi:BspA type Leucine rich repeat region (6 copies)